MQENILIDDTTPKALKLWNRTTWLQRILIIILFCALVFYAISSRQITNIQVVEACNSTGTDKVCGNIFKLTYGENSLVPKRAFSSGDGVFLLVLFSALLYAFFTEYKYGEIDLPMALKLSREMCGKLMEAGKFENLEVNGHGRRQDKFYENTKVPNKWFVGVNERKSSGLFVYYIMLVDAITGVVTGIEKTINGKEFNGQDIYDEKIVVPPWVHDLKRTSEWLGIKPPVKVRGK